MMTGRLGKDPNYATNLEWFFALARTVRQIITRRTVVTQKTRHERDKRRVYYLSMEYLIGTQLKKILIDLGLEEIAKIVLEELDKDYDAILNCEVDPALGNGGIRSSGSMLYGFNGHTFLSWLWLWHSL